MYPSEREEFQWAINDRKALHAEENAARDAEIHSLRTALNRAFDDLVILRREIAALTLKRHDKDCELRGPGGAVERRCSCGFRALRAELATLRGQLAEAGAVCACGCPDAEHEDYGEDGQSCGIEGHECHRVSRSALTTLQALCSQLAAVQQALRRAVSHMEHYWPQPNDEQADVMNHAYRALSSPIHTGAAQGYEMTARAEDVLQRHGEAARELLDTLDVLYQYANDLDRVTRHNRAELAVAVWLDARSTQEPATVCEWRPYEFRNGNYYALVGTCCEVAEEMPVLRRAVKKWKCCPYCTLPLQLSLEPSTPNEAK